MALFDRRGPFRRQRDGTYSLDLGVEEQGLLGNLMVQLRSLLATDSPSLVRLFPPAYGDDEERNRGYAALAGAELMERRLAAIDAVEESLGAERLTEEQLETWMRSVNDLRLVLGTILDVTEDEHEVPDPDDEAAPLWATYEYLGLLLERIIAALSD